LLRYSAYIPSFVAHPWPTTFIHYHRPAAMSARTRWKCSWCPSPNASLLYIMYIYIRTAMLWWWSWRLPWREQRSAGWRHELAPNPKSNRNLRTPFFYAALASQIYGYILKISTHTRSRLLIFIAPFQKKKLCT